jgi:tetratricopeptide (TPR) repeat protein
MISQSAIIRAVLLLGSVGWLLGAEALQAQAKPAADKPADKPADPAPLNMEEEMQAVYQDAYTNFNLGKYDVALQKLGQIHAKTANKEFEQVMLLEGACQFMLEKYDKSAEILQAFVDKFPKSESLVEATINLGRALLKKGDETKGVNVLNKAVGDFPARKGEIGLTLASYHKEKGRIDDAQRILEKITVDGAMSPEMVQSHLMLAEIYTSQGETDKASAIVEKLKGSAADDDTIIQRNMLGLKLGDEMRQKKLYKEALVAYQNVRKQSEIVRIQKSRVARLEQWLSDAAAGRRIYFLGKPVGKDDITAMLEQNRKILEEVEKNKDFDADLFFRLGQCFYEMQRYYEAIAALNEVYTKFPGYANRELALYCMILANQSLQREGRAYGLCEKYVKEFPEGQFTSQVTDLLGLMAYKSGRIADAIRVLQKARDSSKNPDDRQRIGFLLGVVLFESQRFDDSRDAFQTLLKDDPKSAFKDDAEYRTALTYFFQNDSARTRKALREYIAGNPTGQYLVDAQYRLAFIEYQSGVSHQGGDVGKAREILEKLVEDYPNDPSIGQVWSLLGDIYGRLTSTETENFTEKSMKAYMTAVEKAKTTDVLDYAIEAATNILTSENHWQELATMWQTYYATHKDSPNALKAIFEIALAYRRLGRPEEAQQLIAEHISPNLGNQKNEQVEMLINQLVTMLVPRKRGRAAPAAPAAETQPVSEKKASDQPAAPEKPAEAAPAEAQPAAAPAPTFEELETRLKKILTGPGGAESITNGTAQARVLYARALLARLMRDIPKYESLLAVIPDAAKPEELSPLLLATVGDMLLAKGQLDKAAEYYGRLREAFSASEFGDRAPVGLGKIEFARKNYQGALELFDEAIEKFQGSSSILDATLGRAESLLELGRLDEAETLYKTIAATREWKGEPTANALYHLGLIEEKRKEWGRAIAYYQRVILAHQKNKSWLAKSYLHCARCQINDGRRDDAKLVLRQMLARTDLQEQPEFRDAPAVLTTLSN